MESQMNIERAKRCLDKLDKLAKRIKEGPPLGLVLLPTASRGRGGEMESLLNELREALGFVPTKTPIITP